MKTLVTRVLGRPRGWNLARAPAGSSFVLLSRGRTRYRLEGPSEGPLLLLVHGMTYPLELVEYAGAGPHRGGLSGPAL